MAGGARPGAGRKAGVPNKSTADVKAAAAVYTTEALKTLVQIMQDAKQPGAARISAATAILDRGHGKAVQPVNHELDLNALTDEQIIALGAALGAPAAALQGAGRDREAPVTH